jgi:hypothetical protein
VRTDDAPPDAETGSDATDAPDTAHDAADDAELPDVVEEPDTPKTPGLCDPSAVFGEGSAVAGISNDGRPRALAVTPDERTVAWIAGEGTGAALRIADRGNATGAFGAPRILSAIEPPPSLAHRVALSPDGLRLIYVREDERGLAELRRSARTDPFGTSGDATPFAEIDEHVVYTGRTLGAPILAGGRLFVMTAVGSSSAILSSTATASGWSSPRPVDATSLTGSGGRLIPSGVAEDLRAYFWWSESESTVWSGHREAATTPLARFVEIGAKPGAQPNAGCTALWFTVETSTGAEIRVARR